MKFRILKFDNDYNQVVDWTDKEFASKKEAEDYCKERSLCRVEYSIWDGKRSW